MLTSIDIMLPSDFIQLDFIQLDFSQSTPIYWYEGHCPITGHWLRLPRTTLAEQIAHELMQQLANDPQYEREGKMYGILLAETETGERCILKAFSGLLNGKSEVAGWVPPISGREQVALEEAQTLANLDAIKYKLATLKSIPERQQHELLSQEFAAKLQQLTQQHQERKQQRQQQRQHLTKTLTGEALTLALEQLDDQSRLDGIERRRLKQQRNAALNPLQQTIAAADDQIRLLRQRRQVLSRQLQQQMHAAYRLTNFAGESLPLQALKSSLPTGTGDCCAPKLLHYAATHQLKPLAMAEFWWGSASTNGDRVPGEFYGACAERCQPLMGFLLSGLPQPQPINPDLDLPVLYEDAYLIAINKPAGLLSTPGRYANLQDSVVSRLQIKLQNPALMAVHRLDQGTSGILLLAKDRDTHGYFSRQFQQRRVHKIYEAILTGTIATDTGSIDLPLRPDPTDRPRQKVDWQRGKPSQTNFRVISRTGNRSRVEFMPITGRTHQLRVHAADQQGLGTPILGDWLYGGETADRLHLHARELSFQHPQSEQQIHLRTTTEF